MSPRAVALATAPGVCLLIVGIVFAAGQAAERRARDHAPAVAVLEEGGRVRVLLCDASEYVVDGETVYFPTAERVPGWREYREASASALRAARQLRWTRAPRAEWPCERSE